MIPVIKPIITPNPKKITIKIIIDLLFKDIFLNNKKYTTISCNRLWVNAEIQLIDSNDRYFLNL